jgi:equilibrative nucleoside transporter 1/2/3
MLCLALLTFLLTLSTFIHLSDGLFATFIITTAIALACCGAYLQTSVVAVASLFGPTAIQSLISGQAVVAVILSAVQLISATGSLHASQTGPAEGVAETKSARLFFGISTSFLFACGAANAWMTRLPSFKAVVPDDDEPWIRRRLSLSADLRSPRPPSLGSPLLGAPDSKANWDRILSVARRNILYEIAVAYVFMTTLVSCPASSFNQSA